MICADNGARYEHVTRLRTAVACTCTGILQHALQHALARPPTTRALYSANSIMNVIKLILIAVAYAIIELASQKVCISISLSQCHCAFLGCFLTCSVTLTHGVTFGVAATCNSAVVTTLVQHTTYM